jgi:hypothetical protein
MLQIGGIHCENPQLCSVNTILYDKLGICMYDAYSGIAQLFRPFFLSHAFLI